MAILIKDKEVERLIWKLAGRTGGSIAEAVKMAVVERMKKVPLSKREIVGRRRRIDALLAKLDAMPTVDHRTVDDIIGYNDRAVFE